MSEQQKQDGGPAFPARIPLEYSREQGKEYPDYSESGMTLRDYFAAKALPAVYDACERRLMAGHDMFPSDVARGAYVIADAMLKERAK